MTAKNKTFLKHLHNMCSRDLSQAGIIKREELICLPYILNNGFISACESKSVEAFLVRFNN